MADEKVNVVIKFDAKTRQLDSAIAKMAVLNKFEKRFASGQQMERFASRAGSAATKMAGKWKKSFDLIDAAVKMTGKFLTGFLKTAIKGVIGQMGLFGAAMIGVHATFVAGQLIMKAYRGAMQLVAGGAAAATMAIAAFSSALREQQAAMFAYRGKGAKEFGSGMNQTRMAMRNLQADASLATLGVEALNKAYGTMSKSMNVAQINASTATIRALMDFGSAGQDPAKGLEQVAVVIASLSDKKKNISDVITEAKKLGPEMETALKKANVKTKAEFEKLLMSGKLAEKGGVVGQFNNINNTLIGQLKGYMTRLRTEFADFGDQFLEPLKVAFEKIFDVIRRDLSRIEATIMQTVGTQGMIDGLVGAFEKTSNFMVKLMREYLPRAIGLFGRIGDWMREFKRDWNIVLERLRPLISGARVLYNAMSPIWEAIKDGLNQIFDFNNQLLGNEDRFKEFGTNIASIITIISDALANMRQIFETISPFINDVLKGFGDAFRMVTQFLTGGAGKSFLLALAPLIAMQTVGSKMAGVTGRMSPVLGSFSKAVTIQAQTATIVAAGMAGQVGPTPTSTVASRPTAGTQQPISGGSFSSGARAGVAAASNHIAALANAGFGYGRQFATKPGDSKNLALAAGKFVQSGLSSGAGRQPYQTTDALQNTIELNRYRDLRNMPMGSLKKYIKGALGFSRSRGADAITQAATLRGDINKATAAIDGPFGFMSPFRRMLEPITGGIGGTLAGGQPTNEQYQAMTGGMLTTLTEDDRRADREGLITPQSERKRLIRERRRLRGQLALNTANRFGRRVGAVGQGAYAYLTGPVYDPDMEVDDGQGGKTRGGFTDPAGQRAAARQRMIDARQMEQGRLSTRLRYMRDVSRINRGMGTRFGRMSTKLGTSAGGKFGTATGLGMLSQAAPEEMRGAMAMGAMAAQFDPRLGLAVAGTGGAMTARGAGKGALSGAAGGAAIGAFFSVPGMIIGGAIGGLVGAIMGAANQAKHDLKIAGDIGKAALMNLAAGLAQTVSRDYARNQERIAAGGTFAPGTRGALQGLAGATAKKIGKIESFIGLQSGGPSYDRVTEYNKLALELSQNPTTERRMQIIQQMNGIRQGRVAEGVKSEDAVKTVRELYARQGEFGISMSKSELAATTKNSGTAMQYLNQLVGPNAGLSGYMEKMQVQTDTRMRLLEKTLGKTGPELEDMARTLGVDLYDATITYKDLLKELGGAMILTSQQLKSAATDAFLAGANPFKQVREAGEGMQRINQSSRGLRDKLASGKLSKTEQDAEINAYMEGAFNDILALAGGDPLKALAIYEKSFGQGATGGQFGAGQVLGGYGELFYGNETFVNAGNTLKTNVIDKYAGQLSNLLGEGEMEIDYDKLMGVLGNMSTAGLVNTLGNISNIKSFAGKDKKTIEGILRDAGLDPGAIGLDAFYKFTGEGGSRVSPHGAQDKRDIIAEEVAKNIAESGRINGLLETAISTLNGKLTKEFFTTLSDAPKWWQDGLVWNGSALKPPDAGGDTSTPRGGAIGDTTSSKLQQTMNRHAALNSQVPGNRSVTSAWRDHNLGSINSDHVTGRAYDLVGQNLGKYQTLVREGGGFAEFHGNFNKRHLHVVPGAGAMGDMSSPAGKVSATATAGPTINNHYNIEINGTNMSPEAIADVVMDRIDKRNRSYGERS